MKPGWVFLQIGGAVALLAAGAAGGAWFVANYDIVPRGAFRDTPPGAPPPFPDSLTQAPETVEGPAAYVFTPGERLRYRLEARVLGSGVEQRNDPLDVALNFAAEMGLDTHAVNDWGEGELELRFDQVRMEGRFMGSPVTLAKSAEGTRFNMPGLGAVDTRRGQSTQGIPQLAFLETPIEMRVGRDGRVRDVRGVKGFERILTQVPVLASGRAPEAGTPLGTRWETHFELPVPGLDQAPRARAVNTFTGYETLNDRRCAVVRQELNAEASDGSLTSPESILGGAMSFSMPEFVVSGSNVLYYEPSTGHLVRADLDVHFGLSIGRELQGATQLLGMYGSLLNDIEDGTSKTDLELDTSENLMELGVDIDGVLALLP